MSVKGKANRCVYCGVPVRGRTCANHRHFRPAPKQPRCIYCGVKIPPTWQTCFGHSDLPALDPLRNPALSSPSERLTEGGRLVASALTTTRELDA